MKKKRHIKTKAKKKNTHTHTHKIQTQKTKHINKPTQNKQYKYVHKRREKNGATKKQSSLSHQISQKFCRWLSRTSMLGMREYTMDDHACRIIRRRGCTARRGVLRLRLPGMSTRKRYVPVRDTGVWRVLLDAPRGAPHVARGHPRR